MPAHKESRRPTAGPPEYLPQDVYTTLPLDAVGLEGPTLRPETPGGVEPK